MPQFALIPNNTYKKTISNAIPKPKYARKYKTISIDALSQDLDKINWSTANLQNANLYGSNFLHVFYQALDIHAPITEIKPSKRDAKRNAKPWITKDILKLIKTKDKIYKKFIKQKNTTIKEQIFKTYKQQKNEITKIIKV